MQIRCLLCALQVGIEMKFKGAQYPVLIGATHVPELNELTISEDGVHVGASVSCCANAPAVA